MINLLYEALIFVAIWLVCFCFYVYIFNWWRSRK